MNYTDADFPTDAQSGWTMHIVSENTPDELRRNFAQGDVDAALRQLAANLMRVARGAGRPWELGPQAQLVVETMLAYREAVGCFPASEAIAAAISLRNSQALIERVGEIARDELEAQQDIIHGALQIGASRLLGQMPQETMGRAEMMRGIRDLREANAEHRRKWAKTQPASKATRRPAKMNRKPKAPLIEL